MLALLFCRLCTCLVNMLAGSVCQRVLYLLFSLCCARSCLFLCIFLALLCTSIVNNFLYPLSFGGAVISNSWNSPSMALLYEFHSCVLCWSKRLSIPISVANLFHSCWCFSLAVCSLDPAPFLEVFVCSTRAVRPADSVRAAFTATARRGPLSSTRESAYRSSRYDN